MICCLIDLRYAASHNYGLEAKVFSRLFVNFQLWLGGCTSKFPGVALHMEIFPLLTCVATHHPNKMRDSSDVRDMIQYVNELTNFEEARSMSL